MLRLLSVCLLSAAALLAGCATGLGVEPGIARDQVLARAGRPTATVPLPGGGERLQYSQQPFGFAAYMVDLDATGRVTQVRQVLTERELLRIVPGWTRAEVEREFGRPAKVEGVANWDGPIHTYRWYQSGNMLWHVYFDAQGIVRRAHPAIEHLNDPADKD